MKKNEQLKNKVKFLYYDKDMTQKDIAKLLGKSRQWINTILNSDEKHQELTAKKKQKRTIERNIEYYKNSNVKVSIPTEMTRAIGLDEEERKVKIRVDKKRIIIEKF